MKKRLELGPALEDKNFEDIIAMANIKSAKYLEKLLLKSKIKELKGTVKIFDKTLYKKEVALAKTNFKSNFNKIYIDGKLAQKILKDNKVLISDDGTWYETRKIITTKSASDHHRQEFNNFKKKLFKKYLVHSKTEQTFLKKKILKLQYKIALTNFNMYSSYQQEYLNRIYQVRLKYLIDKNKLKLGEKEKIKIAKNSFYEHKKNRKILISEFQQNKIALKKAMNFKTKNLSTVEKRFYKNKLKINIQELKYKNLYYLWKSNYRFAKISFSQKKRRIYNEYISEINNYKNTIPYECNKTRKWYVLLASFIPGLGQIINGQLMKGLLVLFIGIPIITGFLLYCFGIGNIGGNGLMGLKDFGSSSPDWPDSNFYLIEGVISLILFSLVISIYISIIRDAFYGAIKLQKGSRLHNWSETRRYLQNEGFPYLLSLPALFLILFIVIVPIISTVLISFTNYGIGHVPPGNTYNWIGFENYKRIFSGPWGESFRNVLTWTILWTIFATMGGLIAGMGATFLLASKRIRGRLFFRLVFILPWAIPAFITIILFSIIFGDNNLVDEITKHLGLQYWKRDALLTKIALIFIQSWLGQSYIFLLTTGVMQGISKDLYDAAKIDGASSFRQILKITLPIIIIQIAPLLLGSFTFNFNNFSIIWLFNGGGPNPLHSTIGQPGSSDILLSFIFKLSTGTNNNAAMGAAFALLTSVLVIGVSSISFRNMKAFKN